MSHILLTRRKVLVVACPNVLLAEHTYSPVSNNVAPFIVNVDWLAFPLIVT